MPADTPGAITVMAVFGPAFFLNRDDGRLLKLVLKMWSFTIVNWPFADQDFLDGIGEASWAADVDWRNGVSHENVE